MAWRTAYALDDYRAAVNARYPNRSKASDGTIGDSAHAGTGQGSDHNPWIVRDGVGVVRAFDLTHDPKNGVDCEKLSDYLFEMGKAGDRRLRSNGYIIFNWWITNSDWSGWHRYNGSNGHTSHMHISFSDDRFDDRANWDRAFPQKPITQPEGSKMIRSLIDGKEYTHDQMVAFADYHNYRIDKIVTELGKKAGIDTSDAGLKRL